MAYIANKPVRFDRDYKVGEVIPESVIAPGMARKLEEMGRILRVDLPQETSGGDGSGQPQEAAQDGAENASGGDPSVGGTDTQAGGDGARTLRRAPLAAHSRSHKD